MYFDLDDRHADIDLVGRAINRRDGVAVAVAVHVLALLAILFLPDYLPERAVPKPIAAERNAHCQPQSSAPEHRI